MFRIVDRDDPVLRKKLAERATKRVDEKGITHCRFDDQY
jgi:RNA binding exosome subunit